MADYQLSDVYSFDKNAGLVLADTSDIKSRVENMMQSIFGADVDMTAETPMGRLVECITVLMTMTIAVNAQNANQYNIYNASGIFLDAIGNLYMLPRNAATHTRVYAIVTGTEGTVIPTTAIAENNAGYKFSPENEITIGSDGTAKGYFLALESGAIPCDKGTLTIVSSGIVGWDTITNNTEIATVYGTDIESDKSYRDRLVKSRARGTASVEAISNAVYNADSNITSCVVLENYSGNTAVKSGVTMPPHSVYICVYGGDNDAIAQAIYDTKTLGAQYTKSAGTATAVSKAIKNSTVVFHRPVEVLFKVDVSVDRYLYAGSDLVGDVQGYVRNFFVEKGIGATIDKNDLLVYLAEQDKTIKVKNAIIGYVGADTEVDSVTLDAYKIASCSTSNVTVVEV